MSTALEFDARLADIMRRYNVRCTPEEFHQAVNVTFHEFESEEYDRAHRSMWESLPHQFNLLVGDWLKSTPAPPAEIHLLDVGCGTGLASDSLVRSPVGSRIRSVTLLDTSPAMLRQASERAGQWGIPFTCHQGLLDSLVGGRKFELISVCSVLHHVPDLAGFTRMVRSLQAPDGVFLHLQDPNLDSVSDPEQNRRLAEVSRQLPEWIRRLSPKRVAARVARQLKGEQGNDYVSKTNRMLMEKGLISSPLSVSDLYSITEVHATGGDGISIRHFETLLPDYDCISHRSYSFFGPLLSELPPKYQAMEKDLIARGALNGVTVAAAWRLRSGCSR